MRELENAIERAVVLGSGAEISPADLGLRILDDGGEPTVTRAIDVGPFHECVESFKKDLIRRALEHANGNQTRAAELLGLQRTYLSRLIKNLGLRGEGD